MARLEALQHSLDRDSLLPEHNEDQFRAHAAQGMYASSKCNNLSVHFCSGLAKAQFPRSKAPTLPVYILEEQAVLMSPPLALIHTVRPVQLRKLRWSLFQEPLVFYLGH